MNERTSGEMLNTPMDIPRLNLSASSLHAKVTPRAAPSGTLAFTTRLREPDREIELVPYHRIAHERYTLYWRLG